MLSVTDYENEAGIRSYIIFSTAIIREIDA
jgi:hypothetical protein